MSRQNSGLEESLLGANQNACANFLAAEAQQEGNAAGQVKRTENTDDVISVSANDASINNENTDLPESVPSPFTLKNLDKNVLTPLALSARGSGALLMIYANDEKSGLPSIFGPLLMAFANLNSAVVAALAHFGAIKNETAQAIQMRNLPVLFTMVCAFMMAEQVDQLESNIPQAQKNNIYMVMAAIASFAAPIALYISGAESALKKCLSLTNDDYAFMTKLFVLPALAMFYYITRLNGVLVLASDEIHQTMKHAAPRVAQAGLAVVRGITTFCQKENVPADDTRDYMAAAG